MKRKTTIFTILSVFVLMLAFVLSSCGGGNKTTTEAPTTQSSEQTRILSEGRTIKVVQLEGDAEVVDETGTTKCFKGMNLYDGDKLIVKENSVLVVKFDEDKYVYLGENTTVNVKSEGKDKYKTNLFVEKGQVLAEIQRQLGVDEEFFLSSNNSVMAVRGTVFGITVRKLAENIIQKYSVYRGVTELYLFDTAKNGNLISGKISDVQNSQYEIVIPEDEILDDNTDYNKNVDNWLKDVDNDFDDSEGANEELEEVQITVGQVSEEEYKEIIETIKPQGGTKVTYSNINYSAHGYYGTYDGLPHSLTIDVETEGAKVYYKTSEDGEYSETNPTFTEPGYHRTYYKITCDGYDDKEDYGVVQIAKGDLEIEYKDNLIIPGLIQGMSLENALANIDLADYIGVKGAEKDSDALAKTTFSVSGNLVSGLETYEVTINLDDSIKDIYKPITAEISLTAYEVVLESTEAIYNGVLDIDYIYSFNKYNGVSANDLFANPSFSVGGINISPNNVTFNYDYITEGYYELTSGKNIVEVVIEFDDFTITTDVYFMFNDQRTMITYDLEVDDVTVVKLAEGYYYFNTNDITVENNNYVITTAYLASHFDIGGFEGYINLPTDVEDTNSDDYLVSNSNTLLFPVDSTSDVEFVIFPSSTSRGSRKIISVYFSTTAPDVSNFPTYTIKSSLSYYPGSNFDFVISESPVAYSLDGKTYTSTLSISELGEHEVYFKVGNSIVVKGSKTVLITTGGIESPGLDLISNQILILSTDGIVTQYGYDPSNEYPTPMSVTSEDETAVSPINDIYEIYTNVIKNSKYYNDLTHEEVQVEVSITPDENNRPNFSYEVMSDGYASLKGSVEFVYAFEYNPASVGGKPEIGDVTGPTFRVVLSVVNPTDLTVSLSDVDRVYASRIAFSLEDVAYDYEILYSTDEGETWSEDAPVFTAAGQYKVYSIYSIEYGYDVSGEPIKYTIVAIQNITVTA